jgi:hypothetical protein
MGDKMQVNGNIYTGTEIYKESMEAADAAEALKQIFRQDAEAAKAVAGDSVTISEEAIAALEADDNPVLEEVKRVAMEKYFHFGGEYLKPIPSEEEKMSALDEVSRYFQAYNDRAVDKVFDEVAQENRTGSGDFIRYANQQGANTLLAR